MRRRRTISRWTIPRAPRMTRTKVNPPLRTQDDVEAIKQGLLMAP